MSKATRPGVTFAAVGIVFLIFMILGTSALAAQAPGFGSIKDARTALISAVPQEFAGTWHWTTPSGSLLSVGRSWQSTIENTF